MTENITNNPNKIVFTLASVQNRLIAAIIDIVIFSIVSSAIYFMLNILLSAGSNIALNTGSGSYYNTELNYARSIGVLGGSVLFSIVGGLAIILTYIFFYIIIPTSIFRGQTIGKKLLTVKVIKSNGEDIDFFTLIKRSTIELSLLLIQLIPCFGSLCCCAFPMYFILNLVKTSSDEKRQSFGDQIAQTVVISIN